MHSMGKVLRWLGIVFGAVVLCVVAVFALLQTRPGKAWLAAEIAQTLGISRIPVREALIALEREGWVSIEMHRGAFVNAIDADAVRDHYELLGLVHGFAASRALSREGPALAGGLAKASGERS